MPTGDMAARRYKIAGAVVRLDDSRVLVAAGSRTAEVYDPATGTFQVVAGDADTAFNFSATVHREPSISSPVLANDYRP